MSDVSAEKILESIRDENAPAFDAYVSFYAYFEINRRSLGTLDLASGVVLDSELLEELEEMNPEDMDADERKDYNKTLRAERKRLENDTKRAEQRFDALQKFGDKFIQYLDTLEKLRSKLGQKDIARAEQRVKMITGHGMSVEDVASK